MKTEHGQNFLTSSHLYQAAKQEVQKALGSIGIKPMAEAKVEPIKIKSGEKRQTAFQTFVKVVEIGGAIYGALDAGYMLWTKANTGHTDELTTRLFQTVYDEVQAGLNNNKVVIPGVDGKDLTVTMTPATPSMTPTETLTPTVTPTSTETQVPTPEKTFPVCKTERFKDCVIYDGASIPDAIKAISQYQAWLPTLSKPFDATKIKDVPLQLLQQDEGNLIVYDLQTAPNFNDPATRPFRRNVTAGVIYIDYNGTKVPYLVRPIELYDKNDPQNNKWVVALKSYYGMKDPQTGEYIPIPNVDTWINTDIGIWKNSMNTTPILTTPTVQIDKSTDPLVQEIFNENPDMPQRFNEFVNGNVGALSKSGVAVLTEDYEGSGLYK